MIDEMWGRRKERWSGRLPDNWFGKLGHGDLIHPDSEPMWWKTGLGHEVGVGEVGTY